MQTRRSAIGTMLGLAAAGPLMRAAEPYTGPVPPKKDIPYLLAASNLIETEVATASQTTNKHEQVFSVAGSTSPARTPLAEPIFLFRPDRISAQSLGLYRFEVKGDRREIDISSKRGSGGAKLYHTSVREVSPGLFRIEAAVYLENGEYSLSPEGENTAFCFTVF